MGDEFTPEELKALEGEPEDPPEPDAPKVDDPPPEPKADDPPPAEPAKPEPPVAEPGIENMIPQSRFDKVYGESKTFKEKLDLLKTDPEKYYAQYPDERPATPAEKQEQLPDARDIDIGKMVVVGGAHDGKTVDDVLKVDPVAGHKMIAEYWREQDKAAAEARKTEAQKEAEHAAIREAVNAELKDFGNLVAVELFDAVPENPTEEQKLKVGKKVDDLLNWMTETNRPGYKLKDAYHIMTAEKGSGKKPDPAELVASASRASVRSVSAGTGGGEPTGYESDMAMTAKQLADKFDKMPDDKAIKWLKEAPEELKKKYPNIPWG